MKAIYTHLNSAYLPFKNELKDLANTVKDVPPYTFVSMKQTQKFLKEECILLDDKAIEPFKNELVTFFNICKINFPSFYSNAFWLLTLLRLYVVFLYATKNDINTFIHLENDNIIYQDTECLKNLPPSCYFTQVGPECGSAGFMFCNSLEHLRVTFNSLFTLLKKGEQTIKNYTNYSFLSEMILIDLLVRGNKAKYLPLIPTDNYFNITNCVFDGASYGQYIGGTNNDKPGWFGLNHYVGQLLYKKQIQVYFQNKQPIIVFNNKKIDIFNLHIHSKKLLDYV